MTGEQLRAIPGVSDVSDHGLDWLLRIEGDGREVLKKLSDLPVRSLRYRTATLDEIYEKLFMGRNGR
jgi:hypothetical protein